MATAPTHSASSAGGSLLHLARRPLLAALVMLLAAAGALGASHLHHAEAQSLQQNAQADHAQAAAELAEAEQARDRLEANLREFEALQRGGFVREPDRVALLEQVEATLRGMPDVSVRWTLLPPIRLESVTDAMGQPIASRLVLPMQLESAHIHEVEWFRILKQLRIAPPERVRLQACSFEPTPFSLGGEFLRSLSAQCLLLWYYVIPEGHHVDDQRPR